MTKTHYGLKIGVIINPVAGLGGQVALSGSDGEQLQTQALKLGAKPLASLRFSQFLEDLVELAEQDSPQKDDIKLRWLCFSGEMGSTAFGQIGSRQRVHPWLSDVVTLEAPPSTAEGTRSAVGILAQREVDLLIFVGGDGTARDILDAINLDVGFLNTQGSHIPVLGLPAGVKMHSGVFAISPRSAAQIVNGILRGAMIAAVKADVRDFDPTAKLMRLDRHSEPQFDANMNTRDPNADEFRGANRPAQVAPEAYAVRVFGELTVPNIGGYMQQTKVGGIESEPLVVEEICADIVERCAEHIEHGGGVLLGPGSTCAAIKQALGIVPTLRGFDYYQEVSSPNSPIKRLNLIAQEIQDLLQNGKPDLPRLKVVISFTRQQGFLFGRGNQQLNQAVLAQLSWPQDVYVVGSRSKLSSLQGRPLLVDSGDIDLNQKLCGLVEIICGYEDKVIHRVATDYS